MFESILKNVHEKTPLVHCITNYVTVNDVANILLACGGTPIMADDERDAVEITAICDALVINIGTLNERTIRTMLKTGKKANELSHPVVLDPVGAGASTLRTDTTFKLLKEVKFAVVRGNISEIKTIFKGSGTTKGVDADISDYITDENIDEAISLAKKLSAKIGSVIVATGTIDIVADPNKAYIIRNGHQLMSKISGTGCMLTAVIAAYCASNPDKHLEATAAAVCAFGLSGELAYEKTLKADAGISSFRTFLIDAVSKLDAKTLIGGMKIESR
ncbi:MAG: hydroxyethylthiazole kinase [Clostridiales bacterium]|jgi:hydroxyethylthiazole kinase|nr:hydroxyethylthiazole kinase [Clostridiales bacterium]